MLSASNLRPGDSHVGHGRHQEHRRPQRRFTLAARRRVDSDGANPLVRQAQPHDRRLRHLRRRDPADLRRRRRRQQVQRGTIAQMGTPGHLDHRARHVRRRRQAPLPVHGPARQLAPATPTRATPRASSSTGTPPRQRRRDRGNRAWRRSVSAGRWACGQRSRRAVLVALLVLLPLAVRLAALRDRVGLDDRHVRPRHARARRGRPGRAT